MAQKVRGIWYSLDMKLHPRKTTLLCPCCGMRFRAFAAGSYRELPEKVDVRRYEKTRQDVICPICQSLPRHRILAHWCDENRALLQASDILYFAPEKSMMMWMKRNDVKCVTADKYDEADMKLDIQSTDLPDESYDMVFCNHVLEHVDDFRTALREMFRILRPDGSLICSFPMDPTIDVLDEAPDIVADEDRIRRFGQSDHLRIFGMRADKLLEKEGFSVEKIEGATCPDEIVPVTGPADYDADILFRCKKTSIAFC